ncbi:J domain-containing protein [Noviherbaspirillum sp. Root189]|uniref:J domain-containing protein n=1 Tax=Noviherbaspirillum sp. Root189 TaxID=1736487 RepID=UPI000708C9F8|nr:J domain-containing protein [Noviherbaspirillum sp. Root189]KRB94131.1 hypothetical protein ASE07_00935 [Noviherbaspirillum sp. Root189]
MKTLYDLLGVSRQASLIDIEHGYRRHLNRHLLGNGGRPLRKRDQTRLQSMRNAYLVLSSPSRRQGYDRALAEQEEKRNRMLDIGGAILAVASLVTGLVMIVLSSHFPTLEELTSASNAPTSSLPSPPQTASVPASPTTSLVTASR